MHSFQLKMALQKSLKIKITQLGIEPRHTQTLEHIP